MSTKMPRATKHTLTRGEQCLYRELQQLASMHPQEISEVMFMAAIISPRREYWRLAAAIHACQMRTLDDKALVLPPSWATRPVYAHRATLAWRMVPHYLAVAIKTGMIDWTGRPN